MAKVRLNDHDLSVVIEAFKKYFLPNDRLWLFGSRANMAKRGGDIDLYIETVETDVDAAIKRRQKFLFELWDRIGDQKVDIVLNILSLEGPPLKIYTVAKGTGVQLV